MSAPKVTKGLAYVRVYTSMLNDADLLDCSDAGRLLALVLLLWSADQGTEGVVPSVPRRVQRFAHLEAGDAACERGLRELLEAGFLIADTDSTLRIRSYTRYQLEAGASNRSVSNRDAAFRQHHSAGKHVEPREGCPDCAEAPAAVVETEPEAAPIEKTVEKPRKWNATQLRADFVDCFPAVFADMPRLDGYRLLLTNAIELATANSGLSPKLESNLKNAVLADALRHYLGEDIDHKTINACARGANALSDQDGHYWWILAAQASAAQDWENDTHIIRWLTKVASSKRSEWLEGR